MPSRTQASHKHHIQGGNGEMVVDMDVLGHISQGLCMPAGTPPQHSDFTLIRLDQTQDQTNQGGFPSAVGADKGYKIMFPDGQIDSGKNSFSIVGKIHIFNRNQGFF